MQLVLVPNSRKFGGLTVYNFQSLSFFFSLIFPNQSIFPTIPHLTFSSYLSLLPLYSHPTLYVWILTYFRDLSISLHIIIYPYIFLLHTILDYLSIYLNLPSIHAPQTIQPFIQPSICVWHAHYIQKRGKKKTFLRKFLLKSNGLILIHFRNKVFCCLSFWQAYFAVWLESFNIRQFWQGWCRYSWYCIQAKVTWPFADLKVWKCLHCFFFLLLFSLSTFTFAFDRSSLKLYY